MMLGIGVSSGGCGGGSARGLEWLEEVVLHCIVQGIGVGALAVEVVPDGLLDLLKLGLAEEAGDVVAVERDVLDLEALWAARIASLGAALGGFGRLVVEVDEQLEV